MNELVFSLSSPLCLTVVSPCHSSPAPRTRGLLLFDMCLFTLSLFTLPSVVLDMPAHILVWDSLTPGPLAHLFIGGHQHVSVFFGPSSFYVVLHSRSVRVTPSFQPSLSLTCPTSLLCCSMGNTGNHGDRHVHGSLAVVRYERRLLSACRADVWWRGFWFVCDSACTDVCVCVRTHVAPPIATLWPGSPVPLLPQSTPVGDPQERFAPRRGIDIHQPPILI